MLKKNICTLILLFIKFNIILTFGESEATFLKNSNNIFVLDSSIYLNLENDIILNDYVYIYEDRSCELTFDEIINSEIINQFSTYRNSETNFKSEYIYWAYIQIKSELPSKKRLGIYNGENYINEFYIILPDGEKIVKKTGIAVNDSENDEVIKYSHTIDYIFPSKSETTENKLTILIRFENYYIPHLNLRIIDLDHSEKKYVSFRQKRNLFQGIFNGMLLIMFIYGLFRFIFNKERSFIYYCLYILFAGIISALASWIMIDYVIGDNRFYGFIITFNTSFLFVISYLLFLQEFNNLKTLLPKWNKVTIFLNITTFLVIILSTILFLKHKFYLQNFIMGIVMAFIVSIIIILVIRLFLSKNTISIIFSIGSFLLFTSALIFLFTSSSHPTGRIPERGGFEIIQIGIIAELIVFAYALSYKMKTIELEKRKSQENLIQQLKENELLHKKLNKKLNELVEKRTSEISLKNKILEQQYEEIRTINEEIESQKNLAIKHKDIIEEQKEQIVGSIEYARQIQQAILPNQTYVNEILPENFILQKPCKIVSGDFYWVYKLKENIIITAADCTGHGVPGAFMSMLGITLLNEIVVQNEIIQPNLILNKLRIYIKDALKQKSLSAKSKDGIDIALCTYNTKTGLFQYSAAYHPIFIIRNNEIIETVPDKMPVGFQLNEKKTFTNHEIKLEPKDTLYLFSDGYIDQIGGEEGKKFYKNNFKKLLLNIYEKQMSEQYTILEKTLNDWMKGYSQIDDILVTGFRFDKLT